jgi:hypothetical protein
LGFEAGSEQLQAAVTEQVQAPLGDALPG